MGSRDAYHSSSTAKIIAAARGHTHCTIIAAPARITRDNVRKMHAKTKLSFPGIINHVSGSPHAEAELAVVTSDGTVRRWDPEGGVQTVKKDSYASDRILRCEYSSNPFQFAVGTGVSIELLDSRMARQPLISWVQPQSFSGEQEFSFGAIGEVDLSRNTNDSRDIPRSSTEQIVASDAPLDLRMEDGGEYTHLTGICALREGNPGSASIYQLNSLGDLFSHRVSSGRSQTKSYGTAVQPDLPSGVTAQDEPTDKPTARTLPIPVDAILPEHDTESMQLFMTLPVKVLRRQFPRLPKHEEPSTMEEKNREDETHIALSSQDMSKDVKTLYATPKIIRRFRSRNVDKKEGSKESLASHSRLSRSIDKDELVEKLRSVCIPSASLFRLHRYVVEKLKIEISSSKLLLLLRSCNEFRIRMVRHSLPTDTLRVLNPSLPGADNVHCGKDDPRVATCTCRPGAANSQLPCQSWSCVIPHAVIVSSTLPEILLDDTAPTSAVTQDMPQDLADIITAAHAVYDDMYESE
ncbi:Iodotyrosine dehalogenase 1 [Phytophthora nicotianae]|uniref:Iodotyrosine dehalogenase 1 n=1 Tax=Phytophthora nicotianae TaxID=4792 RepID=A0A0W8DJU7_PHYNI|nr:Iodotyrosine dehalogenase 1 [Phytophthora nicotianae]